MGDKYNNMTFWCTKDHSYFNISGFVYLQTSKSWKITKGKLKLDDLKKLYMSSKKTLKEPSLPKINSDVESFREYFANKKVYRLCKNNLELGLKHINGHIRAKVKNKRGGKT